MVTASGLRQNIYKLLDEVISTGQPLEINRKGYILKIIAEQPSSKLANMKKRKTFIAPGDEGDDLVHLDWSKEWNDDLY